jgi:hypothetical protein
MITNLPINAVSNQKRIYHNMMIQTVDDTNSPQKYSRRMHQKYQMSNCVEDSTTVDSSVNSSTSSTILCASLNNISNINTPVVEVVVPKVETVSSRIPLALQQVFVDSWEGVEVHQAPEEACQTYKRRSSSWSFLPVRNLLSLSKQTSKEKMSVGTVQKSKGRKCCLRGAKVEDALKAIEDPIMPIVPKKNKVRIVYSI